MQMGCALTCLEGPVCQTLTLTGTFPACLAGKQKKRQPSKKTDRLRHSSCGSRVQFHPNAKTEALKAACATELSELGRSVPEHVPCGVRVISGPTALSYRWSVLIRRAYELDRSGDGV